MWRKGSLHTNRFGHFLKRGPGRPRFPIGEHLRRVDGSVIFTVRYLPSFSPPPLTNILLIQLEDVLLHCIPSQQTGFLRHRSILQHVYGSRALWDGLSEGAALSVDFRNAFPTMSHEMVSAALGLMCIPFLYIRLILHLLRAPYLYSVGKGYVAVKTTTQGQAHARGIHSPRRCSPWWHPS